MKKLILLVSIFFTLSGYAQEVKYSPYNEAHKNYKTASKDSTIVTGRVIYESNGEPVYSAIVEFYDGKDAEFILQINRDENKGVYFRDKYRDLYFAKLYTKRDGTFEIKLPYGEYFTIFSSIGVSRRLKLIILNSKTLELDDIIFRYYFRDVYEDFNLKRERRKLKRKIK